jgi:hypothetical protein
VQLTDEQATELKKLAATKGVSMAELVRCAVDQFLRVESLGAEERRRRAMSFAGRFHGFETDLSVEHDKYLDEIYGSWRR